MVLGEVIESFVQSFAAQFVCGVSKAVVGLAAERHNALTFEFDFEQAGGPFFKLLMLKTAGRRSPGLFCKTSGRKVSLMNITSLRGEPVVVLFVESREESGMNSLF